MQIKVISSKFKLHLYFAYHPPACTVLGLYPRTSCMYCTLPIPPDLLHVLYFAYTPRPPACTVCILFLWTHNMDLRNNKYIQSYHVYVYVIEYLLQCSSLTCLVGSVTAKQQHFSCLCKVSFHCLFQLKKS